VAPGDRGAQRGLTRLGVPAAPEQVESPADPLDDLLGRQCFRAGGGQLDGQRHVVEPAAELPHGRGRRLLRAQREELDRLSVGQWQHLVLDLPAHAQELPRRNEQLQVRAPLDRLSKLGRRVDHLLKVVHEQQQLALSDMHRQLVVCTQCPRDGRQDKLGIAQRC
jgi:hypothetical protein